MRVVAVVLLLGIGWGTSAQANWEEYEGYPDYKTVVSEMFQRSGPLRYLDRGEWSMAKEPGGWSIYWIGPQEGTPEHDWFRLWDRRHNRYADTIDLPLRVLPTSLADDPVRYASIMDDLFDQWDRHEGRNYDMALFYGYPSAHADVIEHFGSSGELPAFHINALARAYSREGTRLINPMQSGLSWHPYDSSFARSAYHEDSLRKAVELYRKCIAQYELLRRVDRSFTTIIGLPEDEVAFAYLSSALQFDIIGRHDLAEPFLREAWLDPVIEAQAHNILIGCPPNSILFVSGDAVTYPLYFMQAVKGFRQDVSVVDLSLMAMPRYIHALGRGALGSAPVQGLITSRQLIELPYFYEVEAGLDNLPWKALVSQLRDGVRQSMPTHFMFPNEEGIFVQSADYWWKNEIIELDLVAENWPFRPIHYSRFSKTKRPFGNIRDWGLAQGLTYQLDFSIEESEHLDAARMLARNFIDSFRYDGLRKGMTDRLPLMGAVTTYRIWATEAARTLAEAGEVEEGLRLVNVVYRHLPEWVIPLESFDLEVIEFYYSFGSRERAAEMALSLYRSSLERADDLAVSSLLDSLEALASSYDQTLLLKSMRHLGMAVVGKVLLLLTLLGATGSTLAQAVFPGQKLGGADYDRQRFHIEQGDTIWRAYRKTLLVMEGSDSILYLEVFKNRKLWKLYRYKIIGGQQRSEGIQREYDMLGRLTTKLHCERGQKRCPRWESLLWWGNDSLNKSGWFYDGRPDSLHLTWYDNGQLRSRVIYDRGLLVNVEKIFDRQGLPLDPGTIKNGDGDVNIYSMNGRLIEIRSYRLGKMANRRKVDRARGRSPGNHPDP